MSKMIPGCCRENPPDGGLETEGGSVRRKKERNPPAGDPPARDTGGRSEKRNHPFLEKLDEAFAKAYPLPRNHDESL